MIDPNFLAILRCPIHPDSPPMTERGEFLICSVAPHGYRVVDGIPHMLPEDAVALEAIEAELGTASVSPPESEGTV